MAKYTNYPNGVDAGGSAGGVRVDAIVPKTTSTNTVTVTATAFQVSGLVHNRVSFGMISASKTLTQAMDGTTFRVYTTGKTATLPATHAAGTTYRFVTVSTANGGTFVIKPGNTATQTIYAPGLSCVIGQKLQCAAITAGATATIQSNGTHWFTLSLGGTWSKAA